MSSDNRLFSDRLNLFLDQHEIFQPLRDLAGYQTMLQVMIDKKNSDKNDPNRRNDLYGPYPVFVRANTGRLPESYYDENDPEPWGLFLNESRSGVLWQTLSGMMDNDQGFAGAYLELALDTSLSVDDYARELAKLNGSWISYMNRNTHLHDHHHSLYHSVSCAGCTALAAVTVQSSEMTKFFKENLHGLLPKDRLAFLQEKKLLPLLNHNLPAIEL